jgi:hypothetical protein
LVGQDDARNRVAGGKRNLEREALGLVGDRAGNAQADALIVGARTQYQGRAAEALLVPLGGVEIDPYEVPGVGAVGAPGLSGFVADWQPPLDCGVPVLFGDAIQQLLQSIPAPLLRLRDLDDQGAILDRHVGLFAFGGTDLLGRARGIKVMEASRREPHPRREWIMGDSLNRGTSNSFLGMRASNRLSRNF